MPSTERKNSPHRTSGLVRTVAASATALLVAGPSVPPSDSRLPPEALQQLKMPPSDPAQNESPQVRALDEINRAIAELNRERGTLGAVESRPLLHPSEEEVLRILEGLKMLEHLTPPSLFNEGFERVM